MKLFDDFNMCLELPDQKFFEPNQSFYQHMKRYEDKTVIDAGCGLGHVADGLCDLNILCVGVDVNYRKSQSKHVVNMNVLEYPFKDDNIILVCRPDHSFWVEDLFNNTTQTFIYVGLIENLSIDLDMNMRENAEVIARNVGDDGENMYLLRG